jgi:tRNA-splicing ligase RtcB
MEVNVIGGTIAGVQQPRVFDSQALPADPDALDQVRRGTSDADLAAPPVVLPDFHHKAKLEMPSSIAIATRESIRPTFTSSSVNCGMALIALDCDRPSESAIDSFYRAVRERYPYPTTNRRELKHQEVVRAAAEGASFAQQRWGVHDSDIERIEEFGSIDLEPLGGAARLQKELPALTFQLARLRFGSVGPSNHFVELGVVEDVMDEQAAMRLGVQAGGLTLQYHAGGGVLAGEIGRLFGRRRDYPKHLRAAMAVQKPLAHLASARSLAQLRERLSLYFTDGCPAVPVRSDEGRRLMLANAAAMNYGFAFRLATYTALRSLAVRHFGGESGRLVVDSPHNSIYEEVIDGEPAIVHRHNSCRAFPAHLMPSGTVFSDTGQAVLLPGTYRTSSYLCVAGEKSADSMHSACHGAGTVVQQYADDGLSHADLLHRSTRRFSYDGAEPENVDQLDDRGVDAALDILVRNGLVRPVARLRPLAVLR